MLRSRKSNRQAQQLKQLAAELRWYEAALDLAFRRDVPDLDLHDAHALLEGMDLPTERSSQLALLYQQRAVKPGMKARAVCELQQAQLLTLAAELMWYDFAVRSILDGKGAREATHHDASELLEAMGL